MGWFKKSKPLWSVWLTCYAEQRNEVRMDFRVRADNATDALEEARKIRDEMGLPSGGTRIKVSEVLFG